MIQSWISLGKVHVNGQVVSKAGTAVPPAATIQILAELPKYVCRCSAGALELWDKVHLPSIEYKQVHV